MPTHVFLGLESNRIVNLLQVITEESDRESEEFPVLSPPFTTRRRARTKLRFEDTEEVCIISFSIT